LSASVSIIKAGIHGITLMFPNVGQTFDWGVVLVEIIYYNINLMQLCGRIYYALVFSNKLYYRENFTIFFRFVFTRLAAHTHTSNIKRSF
jgi:hypothetical protein